MCADALKLLLAMSLLLSGQAAAPGTTAVPGEALYVSRHPAMGTVWELYLYAATPAAAAESSDAAFEEVDRIEDLLSNYRDSSELSRINRLAAQGPVVTDPETFQFLAESQHWSAVSDGAFDITVGALMKSWGFFRKSGQVPTPAELNAVCAKTGWQKMRLDPATRSVRFAAEGVELDPGGIGKGFAVDAVLRLLRERGLTRAMISAGSSTIGTLGTPPGEQGWKVVVNAPDSDVPDKQRTLSTVLLRDETLSSANCSEKNFTLGGHRYCHIMDPKTLRPIEGTLQVTIVDPSGTASDALSNVLFVKGAHGSVDFLHAYPRDRALVLSPNPRDARRPICTTINWAGPLTASRCESETPPQ